MSIFTKQSKKTETKDAPKAPKETKAAAPKVTAPKVTKKAHAHADVRAYKILQAPVITERVTDMNAQRKYVFAVPTSATKSEVKKTVNNVYGIMPTKINMITVRANNVHFGRTKGKQKSWKKAVVTLPVGKSIEVYEGV